ncbi:DUF4406 domain-containing protein [Pseudomonas sp. GXZC]|uniref:DUF4406 domain-containing protein n=1 Tax=Pseudomonas sp. GXZC TaxID=3003351 RepID=UPI0022AA1F57|nr:DUF4406 domain-containing protein [Pseudomonas sp. GXZC]WAT26769.1 DUF4406 domain-containing protein [Pseudomonas sp. GXZC]
MRTKDNQDPLSTRLGTMAFTIANELVNHYGKKLDRETIDEITRNLTCEMCQGPTAWAFSGKSQPGEPFVTLQASRANRVYVAGPMTGIADFNYPAFNAVADQLRAQGYEVENPADHGIVEGAQWADYMAYDLTRLGLCGVIALLPDWEKSQGARLEVLIAERLGMTVVNAHDLITREAVNHA